MNNQELVFLSANDLSNKIKGFGFGCKFNMSMLEEEELIISYGLNEFGQKQIHFHTNKIRHLYYFLI